MGGRGSVPEAGLVDTALDHSVSVARRLMSEDSILQRFVRSFPRGTVLFREGDRGNEMYVIKSGRVTISKRVGDVEKTLSNLGNGEFFGEMSILLNRPRSATATVIDEATILVIDTKTFQAMVASNSEIAVRMIKKLADRLQEADDLISNLLLQDASSKVVHYLTAAAERAGQGDGPVRLELKPEELPGCVGIERSQVVDALATLLRAQIVQVEPDAVIVTSVTRLRHFLQFLQMRGEFGEAR